MRKLLYLFFLLIVPVAARAGIFGQIHGIVHDPQHRPIPNAQVTIHAINSAFEVSVVTASDGSFTASSLPLGDYTLTIIAPSFATVTQTLTLASNTSLILHFELAVAAARESISVTSEAEPANVNTATPTTLINRLDIAQTPGADRTNSLAAITDFTPGAYMTHDMLHMRGGHQVAWQIDGVEIPNTNIASNLGAQISPRDIDYLEVQRGSYTADTGDRTYGVFNVVPRTGFERTRQAELILTAGSFLQTDDQLNLGDHSERFAWYASLNGNRSDYGLAPPVSHPLHDATNGYGGFASLIYNRTPRDQFRLITQLRTDFFQIPYDPDPNSFENQQYDSSGLRDTQHENDGIAAFTWLHTFNPSTVLQVSPFFHYNAADYRPNSADTPVASTSDRTSNYAGAQTSITTELHRNTLQAGLYSFGQHDSYRYGALFNDGASTNFTIPDSAAGGVVEAYVSDNYKLTSYLTLIAGLRQTHFQGEFSENYTAPRFGAALRIPRLDWVFRGFYGRFYQPPPLLTAAGPIVQYAQVNNTAFAPLHGERDEEHQFGVTIPFPSRRLSGWVLDVDTFKTRANNFLDHSNIGESSIYYPVTIDGALIRAWEASVRSPRIARLGQFHLAYSNQIAEQRGNITGGLICTPVGDPACDAGFAYTPVDHDQRNTLNVGFAATLPYRITASTNVMYGSGFVNGDPDPTTSYPNPYLPQHTTFDLTLGHAFTEDITGSVTAINAANRRVLLDNSLTFGGFHFNDPREIYAELKYRFHF